MIPALSLRSRFALLLTAALSASLLAACGGGGKSDGGVGGGGGGDIDSGAGGGSALECIPSCRAGSVCKAATNQCVQCLSNSDCTDPSKPLCGINTNACEPDTSSGGDGGTPPANDTCAGAQTVALQTGTIVLTTDTSNATDNDSSSCGGAGNVETVFALQLPANERVAINAVPGSDVDPVLYTKSGSCTSGPEQDCVDVGYPGENEQLVITAGPARTVYLFVETWEGANGVVTLNINTSAPVPGDTCQTATAVTLPASGIATFTVETTDFGPDYLSETCHGGTGPDAIYTVTVPANSDLDVRAEPVIAPDGGALDGGEVLDVQVDIFKGPCTSPTELTCRDFAYAGKADMASLRGLDAGTYYFAIDGYGGTSGLTNVKVEVLPGAPVPSNDACTTDGGLPTLGPVPVAGDTTHARDNNYWSCGGLAAKDVYYAVPSTPATGTLVVTVTTTDGGLVPVVAILGGMCTAASEVACAVGDTVSPTLATTPVDGGSFIIVVDGANATEGGFNVSAVVQ